MKNKALLFAGAGTAVLGALLFFAFQAGGPDAPLKKSVSEQAGASHSNMSGVSAAAGSTSAPGASRSSTPTQAGHGTAITGGLTQSSANSATTPPEGLPQGSASSTASAEAQRQTIMDTIELASTSYDPAQLPQIRPFLTSGDPEVRAAALNGVVVLGDKAGAPLLREAAKVAATPQEASELLAKADYLELPSAPIIKRKKGATPPASTPKSRPPGLKGF